MKFDPKSSAIVFKNWRIYAPIATIANQYDNESRILQVEGNLPAGYRWDMLVQCGGDFDIIPLTDLPELLEDDAEESSKTVQIGALLTASQLSKGGTYSMQLRGILLDDLTTKRHTNVISVRIPGTIVGDETWSEVPSSFSEIEQNILEANAHPPVPGENGYWQIWDIELHAYVESEFPLPDGVAYVSITDISISQDNELILQFSDGSTKNLGCVIGKDGAVYVPSVSDRKILSFTIEDEPTGVPDPVDLNPNDEWGEIDDNGVTDYTWETI